MNIANKTLLITGTSRGLGRALVHEALRRGAKRVYAGTRNGAFEHTDKRVVPLKLDVTNLSQIKQAAEEVDTCDVLINNELSKSHVMLGFAVGTTRMSRQEGEKP